MIATIRVSLHVSANSLAVAVAEAEAEADLADAYVVFTHVALKLAIPVVARRSQILTNLHDVCMTFG